MIIAVVRACHSDLDGVLVLLDEAAGWLQGRGINQWPHPFPRARVERNFDQGQVYLAYLHDQPVGTFTLLPSDPAIWGDQPGDALYLHGLAVRRAASGQRLGHALLRCAEQIVAEQGKPFLRLDCWAGNEALRRYYQQAGFVDRGVVEVCGGGEMWNCRLFEQRIG